MISIYVAELEDVWFGVAYEDEAIFATSFANSERKTVQSLLGSIPFDVPFQFSEKPSPFAEQVIATLKNVYDGKNVSEKILLSMEHLPKYTQKVLKITRIVPLGYVTSYGALAKVAGGSPRAVGNVMASNPFAPIIPCHRVVSSDFTLGGYGGGYGEGLKVKRAFLERERRGYTSEKEISVEGKKLRVFPVEFVLDENLEKSKC